METRNRKLGLHITFLVAIALVFVSVYAGSVAEEFGGSLLEEMDDLLLYSGTSDWLVL